MSEEKKADAPPAEAKAEEKPPEAKAEAKPEEKKAEEKKPEENHKKEKKAEKTEKAEKAEKAAEPAPAPPAAPTPPAAAAAPPAPEPAPVAAAPKPAAPGRGKLLLVAWGGSPAAAWEAKLAEAGYEVYCERAARSTAFQWANENQPVAAVIDLGNQPDDGKKLASILRITSGTAAIPLLFCDATGAGAAPLGNLDAVLGALAKL